MVVAALAWRELEAATAARRTDHPAALPVA